ncbi:hypothetical protein LFU01_17300 [Lysinibacillus fusiformis]|nr:hypothetical protein LFU01_17300 [Lysinibacillus fusiformis]
MRTLILLAIDMYGVGSKVGLEIFHEKDIKLFLQIYTRLLIIELQKHPQSPF